MKALKFIKPMQSQYIDEIVPLIDEDQVLIKVSSTGICHSDIDAYMGKHPYRIPPIISGHEFSGTISKIGKNVHNLVIGDRVCVEPHIGCGKCIYCKEGLYNLCKTKRLIGVGAWGGSFAEYVMAYPSMCIKLPDSMSFEEAALIEPLSVGIHAVELADIPKGANVAILGCGTIGMMTLGAVLAKKPSKVFVSEVSEAKLKLAMQIGATFAVNPIMQDLSKIVMDNTNQNGVDFVFITVPIGPVLNHAIALTRKRGTIVIIALFDKPIELEVLQIQQGERIIKGSSMYTSKDFRIAVDYYNQGLLKLKQFITKRIGFNELADHIDRLAHGELKDEIKIIASL